LGSISTWIGVILTLAVFSYLWKDNPIFHFAEVLFVGLATSNWIIEYYDGLLKPFVLDNLAGKGEWYYLLPMAVGLLYYFRYVKGMSWLARIPIALEVGYGVGYGLALNPRTYLRSLGDSFVDFTVTNEAGKFLFWDSLWEFVFFAIIVCVLVYFFFTRKKDSAIFRYPATFGRWAMMVAFGAAFGFTIMARVSLLIGRISYILGDFLGLL
jgi:hypothetical protein